MLLEQAHMFSVPPHMWHTTQSAVLTLTSAFVTLLVESPMGKNTKIGQFVPSCNHVNGLLIMC